MKIVGVGAGDHARVMIDALRTRGVVVSALTDSNHSALGPTVDEIPVVGGDAAWKELRANGFTHAFIGVGSVGDARVRRRLFEQLIAHGFEILPVIHPTAVISARATLGRGPIVMATAVINAHAQVGDNVIVNTAAVVEHDCVVGDHSHIATGARLAGRVCVGAGVHIGAGATVRQGISIGDGALVGAGAVVVTDVAHGLTVVGVPAKPIARRTTEIELP